MPGRGHPVPAVHAVAPPEASLSTRRTSTEIMNRLLTEDSLWPFVAVHAGKSDVRIDLSSQITFSSSEDKVFFDAGNTSRNTSGNKRPGSEAPWSPTDTRLNEAPSGTEHGSSE
ncbi:hypothetical protein EYF80_048722 [Liparis tanakae]|uniref:Uncharacterized protein n=1 Tax=Liparis tanakae TaxID=230148 RepID=A0A4Z2FJK5_9TELE|nr:hypothetical protein EYF80_048722 [Liparis tanakae]